MLYNYVFMHQGLVLGVASSLVKARTMYKRLHNNYNGLYVFKYELNDWDVDSNSEDVTHLF